MQNKRAWRHLQNGGAMPWQAHVTKPTRYAKKLIPWEGRIDADRDLNPEVTAENDYTLQSFTHILHIYTCG